MNSDSWATRLSSHASRHYQSPSGVYYGGVRGGGGGGGEENEGESEGRPEYVCVFCSETFDIVGLCCHMDEQHALQSKNGVCPVCAKRVGVDLVGHIIVQHGSLSKVQRKRRLQKVGSNSTLSILRKELREGTLLSLLGGSSCSVSSSSTEPDPLLSSFICNSAEVDGPTSIKPNSSVAVSLVKESALEDATEGIAQQPPMSAKDQEEKARKCEFVLGLLLSTFLDDNL